jgi:2-keto-4-pentenoate hydratase
VLSDSQRREAAEALFVAESTMVPTSAPLTELYPSIEVPDAYEIQLTNIRRKLAAGRQIRGHKVGLTAKVMQQMFGVSEPDYGHLLDDMFFFEHAAIDTSRYFAPRVEVEMAFVLGATLPSQGCSAADVIRCTEFVMPSMELIDTRLGAWKIKLCDTVADNASSAGVILGGIATPLVGLDPRTIGAVLRKNGDIVASGATGAVLGNPVSAVAWLANAVGAYGVRLEAGHVILPGSCTAAIDVAPGDTFTAEFDILGSVTAVFS